MIGKVGRGFLARLVHPNAAGHEELLRTFVPTLFEALEQGKPAPKRSTATGFARLEGDSRRVIFAPADSMHPFAFGVTGRGARSGMVAAISGSILTAAAGTKSEQRGNGRRPLEFETKRLTRAEDGREDRGENGVWVYSLGRRRLAFPRKADGRAHDLLVSYHTARGETLFFVDGKRVGTTPERLEPKMFTLESAKGAEFKDLLIYRSALNADEVAALASGRLLQASLEVYSPLSDAELRVGESVKNLAQSLTFARVTHGEIEHIDR
jgi:hypothetical protein